MQEKNHSIFNFTTPTYTNIDQCMQTYTKVILKLSAAMEFRDDESPSHIVKVGLYSALIARGLDMREEDVSLIRMAAPMHDTGKVGISDILLKKERKLSEEEFEIMKQHTQIGYELLYDENNALLKAAAIIAKEHHEKFDGTGYPNALKGEEISIFARIATVADIFDSLSTKRTSQQIWDFDKSMHFIGQLSGKHFDPDIVRVFQSKRDEVYEIYTGYQDE